MLTGVNKKGLMAFYPLLPFQVYAQWVSNSMFTGILFFQGALRVSCQYPRPFPSAAPRLPI